MAYVTQKAEKTAKALARVMPRIGGAGEDKRQLISSVAQSMILYTAEFWAPAMKTKAYHKRVDACQRGLALRIN